MANIPSNKAESVDSAAISHTLGPAQRDTQEDKCWIGEALENEMTCEEHSEYFSTIVYTRGELEKSIPGSNATTDGYLRGKIEVLPSEKSCIFDCPIANKEELISHHSANHLHVYDRFKGEEYIERLLDQAQEILGDLKERVADEVPGGDDIDALDAALEKLIIVDFTKVVEETPLLSTRLLDNVPFSIDLFGGQNGPNAQAWTRRFKQDDPLLECQHMRHLMIRKGDRLLPSTVADDVRRTFSRIPLLQLGDIDHVALERYCRDRDALFDLEWSLLSNLESLCLDLRGIPEERRKSIEALFVKMGRHLRLKTLVLIGVPHLIDFNSVGSKEYVAQQEDEEFLVFPGDEHNSPTELTNYVHFLKECLRPGGELRLIVPNPQT
ncbi:hypothetical protein CEP54_003266 [Fusarium duplospermum]|uniref:Uncharacterized protein n=1 Tax=Fusarium duplospermum TaxID=1325734 RepID=A0A428QQ53_9HYPO|nr:hypothetical protein CEP54_003266 [Fusarium duplospermum]